jgi:hypothetical protein
MVACSFTRISLQLDFLFLHFDLIAIMEISISSAETPIILERFMLFLSRFTQFLILPQISPQLLPLTYFPIYHSLNYLIIPAYRYIVWATDSIVK